MKIEELIAKFAANANLDSTPATNGVWRFSADGNVFGITRDDAGERVFLFGEIRARGPGEALLKAAMEANFFHRGTGGATFALNPETGALTLFRSEPLENLGEEAFYSLIERFVNALATWNGIANQARDKEEEAPAPESAAPAGDAVFSIGDFIRV